jgi:hypothetical protein
MKKLKEKIQEALTPHDNYTDPNDWASPEYSGELKKLGTAVFFLVPGFAFCCCCLLRLIFCCRSQCTLCSIL